MMGTGRERRRAALLTWLRTLAVLAVVIFVYFVVPLRVADLRGIRFLVRGALLLVGVAALFWLVVSQVRQALRVGRLNHRLAALLMVVSMVVVCFAALFYVLADQFNGIRTRLDALYFSVVTLSTVGYGDIVPVRQTARMIVMVQIIFDLIFITSAISIIAGGPHGSGSADDPLP